MATHSSKVQQRLALSVWKDATYVRENRTYVLSYVRTRGACRRRTPPRIARPEEERFHRYGHRHRPTRRQPPMRLQRMARASLVVVDARSNRSRPSSYPTVPARDSRIVVSSLRFFLFSSFSLRGSTSLLIKIMCRMLKYVYLGSVQLD